MKTRTILFSLILLTGCQEETIEPTPQTCDCYTYHERLQSNMGNFTWVYDFSTDTIPDLCEKDNGTWIYNQGSTERYKYICD